MAKLFSYVVHHDTGFAPNPTGKYCTLAGCKFSKTGKPRNIVELAEEGDWVIGTGGANKKKSSGIGTLLYAMKVTKKMDLKEYCADPQYSQRSDAEKLKKISKDYKKVYRQALISNKKFYYFGKSAFKIPKRFEYLIKSGPKYKKFSDIEDDHSIQAFLGWVQGKYKKANVKGKPCVPEENKNKCQNKKGGCR